MKLRIETLTVLFTISVILLAGCSGCGQKAAEQPPVDVSPVGVDETHPPVVETPSTERDFSLSADHTSTENR